MTRIRMYVLLVGLAIATLALATGPITVIIPLETIVRGDPGEILPVHVPVPVSELDAEPGWFCEVAVIAGNGESEHGGTNLIIGSNGDQVIAFDVEATAGGITEAAGTLTLGETVTFDGQLGEDRVLSAGMNVVFECTEERPPPSTTTTTTTSPKPTITTTTEPPSTDSTTTTLALVPPTTLAPPATTTTEVSPPTLIESGDAGYIDEVEEGEEHQDEDTGTDWGFLVALSATSFAFGVLFALMVRARRDSQA